ncbi:MAG: hypothetical protein JO197_15630 [Acidobacteria bacterium]|nr:hypothetical protein [Acidobacteriota bacterium]MBV9475046.1 hypothetical protein [Acidobacteriota bacterium]
MNLFTRGRARRDARAGINTVDHYLTSKNGVALEFDPVGNMEHARISRDLQGVEVEEYRERLSRVEDELTHHEASSSLTLKLTACFVAEVVGCTLLFRGLGFAGIERLVPAILFASFLFWITSETKRQGGAA